MTSRSLVQAYWYRQVCSSGSKTTAGSAPPSMNVSYSAASRAPAGYIVVPVYQSVRSSISNQSRCTEIEASVGASMRTSSPERS